MDERAAVDRMIARLRELDAHLDRLTREMRSINEQREALAREAEHLTMAVQLFEQYDRDDGRASEPISLPLPMPLTGTMADAAAELLRQHGGEMTLASLHEALQAAGKLRASPHSKTTLWKTLNRKSETFTKVGRGRWRLRHLDEPPTEITMTG